MARTVKRVSISMEDRDVETVQEVANLVGGFSAALRMIIRQWAQWGPMIAEQRVTITEAGRAALREQTAQDCESIEEE